MLTLDDVESDTVKRVASFWIGTTTFYAIVEGITFAFRVTQDIHVGEPQALWRGYILISIIPSFIIISLLIIATKKSIPKIEPFLRKLCHNYSYWVYIHHRLNRIHNLICSMPRFPSYIRQIHTHVSPWKISVRINRRRMNTRRSSNKVARRQRTSISPKIKQATSHRILPRI